MAKGISLHIGINQYDLKQYRKDGRLLRALPNCHRDAVAKMDIACRYRFDPAILINEHATVENVFNGIRTAAAWLKQGDIFFLSFSGHGMQVKDNNCDEEDGCDELWCLYDKAVLDDELFELWQFFRPGVRILVIADCCHSGTSIKNVTKINKDYSIRKGDNLQASLLLMAACQDKQTAFAGNNIDHSLYTHWILEVLKQYAFCENYRELHNRVSNHMPENSKPNLFQYGPGADRFIKQRPFKI